MKRFAYVVTLFVVGIMFSTANAETAYYLSKPTNTNPPVAVYAVDGSTKTVTATIFVNPLPVAIAANQAGTTLYVLHGDGNTVPASVTVINTATNSVTASVPVPGLASNMVPTSIQVGPGGSRLWITGGVFNPSTPGVVTVLKTSDFSTVATVSVESYPIGVAFLGDLSRAYVGNYYALAGGGGGSVTVINSTTLGIVASIPMPLTSLGFPNNPVGMIGAVGTGGSSDAVYAGGQYLAVIDPIANTARGVNFPGGSASFCLAYGSNSKKLYAVEQLGGGYLHQHNRLVAYNATTGIFSGIQAVLGEYSGCIALNAAESTIYAGHSYNSNTSEPAYWVTTMPNLAIGGTVSGLPSGSGVDISSLAVIH